MDAILNFFKSVWDLFISFNANAYWAIVYMLTKNWFILLACVFIGVLVWHEISIKTSHIVDDKREMY